MILISLGMGPSISGRATKPDCAPLQGGQQVHHQDRAFGRLAGYIVFSSPPHRSIWGWPWFLLKFWSPRFLNHNHDSPPRTLAVGTCPQPPPPPTLIPRPLSLTNL